MIENLEMPTISVVIPAYNEEPNVPEMKGKIEAVLEAVSIDWELVFVDDGSTDGTWREIKNLAAADARVKGIRLTRNFGHQAALLAGMRAARGDCVASMDCDLQNPPELLRTFLDLWRDGVPVVLGQRKDQETSSFRRESSRLFYSIFNALADVRVPRFAADFRLLDRRVVDALLQLPERDIFLRGMVVWLGFPIRCVEYEHPRRLHGRSRYTLGKMTELATRALVSFSVRPLHISAFGAVVLALLLVLSMIFQGPVVLFMVVSLAYLLLIGAVIAVYLASVHREAKQRPLYIVAEMVGMQGGS